MKSNTERLAEKIRAGRRGIRLLLIHQSFPSQYWNIATHYGASEDNTVVVIGQSDNLRQGRHVPGVILMGYGIHETPSPQTHPYVRPYEEHVRRGQAVAMLLDYLRSQGFVPDVICVHPHWGEGLFLELVYPGVPVLAYGEHYAHIHDPLFDFDPQYPSTPDMRCATKIADTASAVTLATATHVQTPTRFQFDRLPPSVQVKTSIMYDGIDTGSFRPDPHASLTLPPTDESVFDEFLPLPDYFPRRATPVTLTRCDTVVSFINRTLEPSRGWLSFLRAIPRIQAAHPEAHIVIVGRTTGGYGARPPEGTTWRDIFLEAFRENVDLTRIHMPGMVPFGTIRSLLAVSSAHVYLSYPFFVSLSPVEAMSTETPLVFSDTAPLREVAGDGEETALFVDFHSPEAIADAVSRLIADPALAARLGSAARRHVISTYDTQRICIPKWKHVIETLARGEEPEPLR